MCVCEWRQCGGCSCVLMRLCERGCVWAHMMPVEVRRQPWLSVLTFHLVLRQALLCVFHGFCQTSWPTKLQKVPCLYFPSPGGTGDDHDKHVASTWTLDVQTSSLHDKLRSSLHDKHVPMKPVPSPTTHRFLSPLHCHLLRCSLGWLTLRLPSCSSELQAALLVKSDKETVKDARLLI